MRKSLYFLLAAFAFVGLCATAASAQSTATITVTYEVDHLMQISVSSATATLHITTATAGSDPTTVEHTSTTWAITHNDAVKALKIQGAINTDMPTGLTLSVELVAPTHNGGGGTSAGYVAMTNTAADLVTEMGNTHQSGVAMNIKLVATNEAAVIASATKTLTLSMFDAA